MTFVKKSAAFFLQFLGFAWIFCGVAAIFLPSESGADITPVGIFLVIIGIVALAGGRKLWKSAKMQPVTNELKNSPNLNTNINTQTATSSNATVRIYRVSTVATTPLEPVTVECHGCGNKVTIPSNDPVTCEYCGNQVTR